MEDLDKEPEEIPMDEVLSEIRQMLSSEMPVSDAERVEPKLDRKTLNKSESDKETKVVSNEVEPSTSSRTVHFEPDYFLLTPSMRCDLPSDEELSDQVKVQTQRVLSKLQQGIPMPQLSPALEDWLNKNLPAIVEKVVEEKLKHRA